MESGNSSQSNYTSSSDDVPALPSNKYVPNKYDVFLSFTGEDTRPRFVAHLYAALRRVGIETFKDDTKLELSQPFPQKLLLAIQDSSCSVLVLSKNYAFSVWCLKELVQIVKCMKTRGQVVIPVFYCVSASDVRYQKGSYGEALLKHEKYHGLSTLESWKKALKYVSYLTGLVVKETSDEAELIEKFVQHISEKVIPPFPYILDESQYISKGLFGIEQRIKNLNSYVRVELVDRVRMIGIWGMSGIGKTRIARAYYEFMYSQFEGGSFLSNVGEVYENEYNPICLQKQLLSQCNKTEEWTRFIFNTLDGKCLLNRRLRSRKVLVVLDGVDQLKQLEELAANCEWFGPGSRILITTRDEVLLAKHGVTVVYKVESLNRKEALKLFSFHAFKQPHEPDYSREYTELRNEVLTYADGLPLALGVLGTLLSGQKNVIESPGYWRNEFDRFKEYPPKDIIDVLEMGFDKGLEETEKTIFLDIACFFKGRKKDFITRVMDCCGFHPKCNIGITSLVGKSLLTIRDDEIWMQDLLQVMGRQIVTRKFREEPWAWSRLWSYKDLCEVLTYNNYKDKENVEASDILPNNTVEAICIYYPGGDLDLKVFSCFRKLRLLCISGPGSRAHLLASTASSKLHFNCLRFMKWEGYPFHLLPSGFRSNRLVELHLESSCIVELFDNPKMEPMHSLKIINLSHSESLIKIQCLQYVAPNLEELLLSFCYKLKEIDVSITDLKKLTFLDVQCCESLEYLPGNMKFLKVLNLSRCHCLPSTEFYVDRLEELNLSGIIGKTIAFGGKMLFSYCFNFLKRLELRRCFLSDESFPADSFCSFSSLEYLDISENSFKVIPQGILSRLIKLRYLYLDDCTILKRLGELPSSLELISTIECYNLEDPILVTQSNLRCLAALIFLDCFTLVDECNGVDAMLLTSLERHVQNSHSLSTRFDIVIPSRTIPEWFIHRNMNRHYSSISMDLHPNWCNNKWMGFVLCLMYDAGGGGGLVGFQGQIKINGLDSGHGSINIPHTHFLTKMNNDWQQGPYDNDFYYDCSEHVWMIYLPRIHFQQKWKLDENSCRIEFNFLGDSIISSGARLLYEEDIEELKQHQNGEFLNLI